VTIGLGIGFRRAVSRKFLRDNSDIQIFGRHLTVHIHDETVSGAGLRVLKGSEPYITISIEELRKY
jgi:hypothetical protein